MEKLIRNKHWYTESFDYDDDTDISWLGKEKFWLNEDGELIVLVARVYGIDESAFTKEYDMKISEIINEI